MKYSFFFAAPVFPDEEQTRLAHLLHALLRLWMLGVTLFQGIAIVVLPENTLRWVGIILATVLASIVCLLLTNRGHIRLASFLFTLQFWLLTSILALTAGGISAPATTAYLLIILATGILLGEKAAFATLILCSVTGLLLVYLGMTGRLPPSSVQHTAFTLWIAHSMLEVLIFILAYLAARSIRDALHRAHRELAERRRAAEALRDSEQRVKYLADAPFEGIGISQHGQVVDANEQLAQMLQYDLSEVIGRSVTDFVAPESLETVMQHIKSGGDAPYEHIALRKDGTKFPVEVRGRTISYHGRNARVTAIRDITERKRADDAHKDGLHRLEALSRRLVEVQEGERRALARELHDEIGQLLTGLQLTLEMVARLPADRAGQRLEESKILVSDLIGRVRTLSLDLRPTMLDDLGLLPTLLWHSRRFTEQTGVQVTVNRQGEEGRFSQQIETAAYRVIQEALTNVARHSGVREASVSLDITPQALRIEIEDRGVGFDPERALAATASSGLSGMRERVSLLGGTFTIQSAPGHGTRVTANLPVEPSGP